MFITGVAGKNINDMYTTGALLDTASFGPNIGYFVDNGHFGLDFSNDGTKIQY